MDDWPDDDQPENKYLGLTGSQFNLAFFTAIGAVALAAFFFGGVDAVREYLGDEPSPPQGCSSRRAPLSTRQLRWRVQKSRRAWQCSNGRHAGLGFQQA